MATSTTTYVTVETNKLHPKEKAVTRRQGITLVEACRLSYERRYWVEGDMRILDVNDNVLATRGLMDPVWWFSPLGLTTVEREAQQALQDMGFTNRDA